MEINNVTNTVAWMRSMQYEMQQEEPDGEDTILQEVKTEETEADLDRIDFQEGDQALTQIRQRHGKGVYETVEDDPALAWSVKGQTYPSAVRVDRSV
ncbi:MAG: hypothetical protein HFI15_11350 [Lachnospiraceae bacterium]|jgi:hypothetical protein|nr:hypothetical protein [Lachnospiraceae bacterium]